MDFSGVTNTILNSIVSFAQNNTLIAVIVALGCLLFLFKKPKLFFGILLFCIFLVALSQMITTMAGSGSGQKQKLLQEGDKRFDANR